MPMSRLTSGRAAPPPRPIRHDPEPTNERRHWPPGQSLLRRQLDYADRDAVVVIEGNLQRPPLAQTVA